MLYYNQKHILHSRSLRHSMTDAESLLWSRLRRKQLCNIQFYRQKPIGNYIVDFYAHAAKLVIEVDGGQHFEDGNKNRDNIRDLNLNNHGLSVLRFDNLEVLQDIDAVLEEIYRKLTASKNPLALPRGPL